MSPFKGMTSERLMDALLNCESYGYDEDTVRQIRIELKSRDIDQGEYANTLSRLQRAKSEKLERKARANELLERFRSLSYQQCVMNSSLVFLGVITLLMNQEEPVWTVVVSIIEAGLLIFLTVWDWKARYVFRDLEECIEGKRPEEHGWTGFLVRLVVIPVSGFNSIRWYRTIRKKIESIY